MHTYTYSRLGTVRSSATATASTPSSLPFSNGPSKFSIGSPDFLSGRDGRVGSTTRGFVERVVVVFITSVFKRRGFLLLAPLLYISGMLLYMGSLNLDVNYKNVGDFHKLAPPGSVYRSSELFEKLWPFMHAESDDTNNALMTAWKPKPNQHWKPCSFRSTTTEGLPKSNGFLIIEANGGLNQQRLSISDAVAVAGLLNATLMVPIFHLNSVWRDSSKFGDIFDEDFFIQTLRNDVNVVRELPGEVLELFDHNISSIMNLRVKAWSNPAYYFEKVLPKMLETRAVRIAPFSNRLAQDVPSHVQQLRCFANYEALRFADSIRLLAKKMVERMINNSSQSGGKYVSIHLRFEMDMVAFSCCEYDGGVEEKREMDAAREKSWRGKFRKRGRVINPGGNRLDGKCPLTPLEVGMMLRGMGFDNSTSLYIAAGKIYNAEKYMAPLRQMFPRLESKDTLATPEELKPFEGHSSRLAALDYTVCLDSEVFVTTQGGNFPHFLMGDRRYRYGGHAKTIIPDKRVLALLFDTPNISWETFKEKMQDMLRRSDSKGHQLKKPNGSLYTFPAPDCMRRKSPVVPTGPESNYNNQTLLN